MNAENIVERLTEKLIDDLSKVNEGLRDAAIGQLGELFGAVKEGQDLENLGPTPDTSWADMLSAKSERLLDKAFGGGEESESLSEIIEKNMIEDVARSVQHADVHDGFNPGIKTAEEVAENLVKNGRTSVDSHAAAEAHNGAGLGLNDDDQRRIAESSPGSFDGYREMKQSESNDPAVIAGWGVITAATAVAALDDFEASWGLTGVDARPPMNTPSVAGIGGPEQGMTA